MRSPTRAGVETPSPTCAFHAGLSSLGHSAGALKSAALPSRLAPRHCGQSAAATPNPPPTTTQPTTTARRMDLMAAPVKDVMRALNAVRTAMFPYPRWEMQPQLQMQPQRRPDAEEDAGKT